MSPTPTTTPSAPSTFETRVERIEKEVQARMKNIDEHIDQLREGQFIGAVIRKEIQKVVSAEQEEERKKNEALEEQKVETLKKIGEAESGTCWQVFFF